MKTLGLFVVAIGFSSPAFAQQVPQQAYYLGVGGSANIVNFSDQKVSATGISNVYSTATGAFESSGTASGPPAVVGLDGNTSIAPVVQAGYFQHFGASPWLWGAKASYAYINDASTSRPFDIPQYGSYGSTPFIGNAIARSYQASLVQQFAFVPYLGYSFDRTYIYLGGGPTVSQMNTKLTDLVGFADINGTHTNISGTPQSFSSSKWVIGGEASLGATVFLTQSWFLDFNYTLGFSGTSNASYYSTFKNVNGARTYEGQLIGSSSGSDFTQAFAVTLNRAF
jgi:hypothetical protein